MARIAYVDHSFHKKTLSTGFLPEILRRHGHEVDFFWDESWAGGNPVPWGKVQHHDAVIMFQAFCPILEKSYRQLHENVIFIPMLDQFGVWQGPLFNLNSFWEPFQGSKVISFSNAVHAMAIGFGIRSQFCRYFQPTATLDLSEMEGLHGFFWLRREDQIPWSTIRTLISNAGFDKLHIHIASDPGSPPPTLPSDEDVKRFNITLSTWFDDKADLYRILEKSNVFFAPRMEEGIGQSFLEAMSRGQCVVAPNNGTMNEYIIHGLNGLLYDCNSPSPLKFDDVKSIGKACRKAVTEGHNAWLESEEDIVKYILTSSEELYRGKYIHTTAPSTIHSQVSSGIRYASRYSPVIKKINLRWKSLKSRFSN